MYKATPNTFVFNSTKSKYHQNLVKKALQDDVNWRLHGLGMVQHYLNDDMRIHIWDPELCRFSLEETTHNHRFDMTSTVVMGSLHHSEIIVSEDKNGGWYKVSFEQDVDGKTKIVKSPGLYNIKSYESTIHSGLTYTFPRGAYHQFWVTDLVITLVHRGPRIGDSEALFPIGIEPRHGHSVGLKDKTSTLTKARKLMNS